MVIDIVFFGPHVLGNPIEVERKRNSVSFLLAPAGAIVYLTILKNTMKSSINRGVSRFHIPDGTGMTSLLGNQVNGCSVRNSDPLIGRFEMSMVFACVVIDKAR